MPGGAEGQSLSRRGSFLDPPVDEILNELEEQVNPSEMEVEGGEAVDEEEPVDEDKDAVPDDGEEDEDAKEGVPKFEDYNSDGDKIELGEQDLWKCTQPITVIKDISRQSGTLQWSR